MSNGLPLTRFPDFVDGQLVSEVDMQDILTQTRSLVGMVAFGMAGVKNFMPANNFVNVVPGSGLQVVVGDDNEFVFLTGNPMDNVYNDVNTGSNSIAFPVYATGPTDVAISPNTNGMGYGRLDLICVQYESTDVNPHTVNVRSGATITPTTVYNLEETFNVLYVEGTASPSPAPPATPTDWVAYATVGVPAGASSILSGNITLLLETITQIIIGGGPPPIPIQGNIDAGIGIAVVNVGSTAVRISNTGVLSINGLAGTPAITSDDGSVDINVSGSTIDLSSSGAGVGATIVRIAHLDPIVLNSGSIINLTLPTLPPGDWFVEMICHGFGWPTNTGQTMTATGNADVGSFTDAIQAVENTRTLYQCVNVVSTSGSPLTPNIAFQQVSGSNIAVQAGSSFISASLKAVRTS